jgi:Fe-S cluster assembly protein SufB
MTDTTQSVNDSQLREALDSADDFKYAKQFSGLSEEVVRKISFELDEPEWMLEKRLESLKLFYEMDMPNW